jgi:hypothetical protein
LSAAARPPTVAPPANCGWRVVAGCFKGLSGKICAVSEDIHLSEVTAGVIGRAFCARKASASRVAKCLKESPGFNKNITKSGALTMGVRGLDSSYSNYRSYLSLRVLLM